ncbi:hypothetical protein EBU24_00745 [bacterium]|nr:hypothetical protein [bacterium]
MSFAALGVGGTIAAASALTTAGTGIARAIGSGKKARQAELEQFAKQSPLYTPSKSIQDYYQQAMNRFNENPYQSQQYKMGAMNAQRATAQGIGALQDRRSAIGGISRLAAGQENAMQNLGAQAEAQRSSRFGQLGSASQMQAAEQAKAFDINKMTPYNRMLQLKQYKAQAAADENAAGWGMVGQGLGNLASIGMMAGTGANVGSSNSSSYTPTWYAQGTKGQQAIVPTGYVGVGPGLTRSSLKDYTNMTLSDSLPSWAKR